MQKQLELWPDQEEQKTQEIWNNLNLQQKEKIITALSRLVSKCVHLKKTIKPGRWIMMNNQKIKPNHLQRTAYIYIRQSTAAQVEFNRESTERQYKLKDRAIDLGWPAQQIRVIDKDLAQSGSSASQRKGFGEMISEVALGKVGLILSIDYRDCSQ